MFVSKSDYVNVFRFFNGQAVLDHLERAEYTVCYQAIRRSDLIAIGDTIGYVERHRVATHQRRPRRCTIYRVVSIVGGTFEYDAEIYKSWRDIEIRVHRPGDLGGKLAILAAFTGLDFKIDDTPPARVKAATLPPIAAIAGWM